MKKLKILKLMKNFIVTIITLFSFFYSYSQNNLVNKCEGDTVKLEIIPSLGDTYQWYKNDIIINNQQSNILYLYDVNLTYNGLYTIKTFKPNDIITIDSFTVNIEPKITLDLNISKICQSSSGVHLSGGYPIGGSYSGDAVLNDIFYPAFSKPGLTTITYTYSLNNSCINYATDQILVDSTPSVTTPLIDDVCELDVPLLLSGGNPLGGTYGGNNVTNNYFNIQNAGVGIHPIYYKWKDSNGCIGQVNRNIKVNPLPLISIDTTIEICYEEPPFILTHGIPVGGTWSGIGVYNNMFNAQGLSSGKYILTYSYMDSNGCVNSDTTSIIIKESPDINIIGNKNLCLGDSTLLIITGGVSYSWNNGSTSDTIIEYNFQDKTYIVTVTDSIGCNYIRNIPVTINPIPSSFTKTVMICLGDSVELVAPEGLYYSWSNGINSRSNKILVNSVFPTIYKVTVENEYNCFSTSVYYVNGLPLPIIKTNNDLGICVGDSVNLSVTGGVSYTWNTLDTISNIMVKPVMTTLYSVTGTDYNGCKGYDNVMITVNNLPVVTVIPDNVNICNGDDIKIIASGGLIYKWSNNINNNFIIVSPDQTTSYTVTVTDNNNCANEKTITVNVNDLPVVNIGQDTSIRVGEIYQFNPIITSNTTFKWYPTNNISDSTIINPYTNTLQTTSYVLTVIDSNGCVNKDTMLLTVLPMNNSLTGIVLYDNLYQTPLHGYTIDLVSLDSTIILTTQTNINGNFYFNNIPVGIYSINGTSNKPWPWGTVNSVDALVVAKHFVKIDTLQGLPLMVGDVDKNGAVNSTDALRISQRFTGLINNFIAGDWLMESDTIIVQENDFYFKTYKCLVMGDVNRSYNPTIKSNVIDTYITNNGIITTSISDVEIPITVNGFLRISSLSINIDIPPTMEVLDLKMSRTNIGVLNYGYVNDMFTISWFDINEHLYDDGDVIFYLRVKLHSDMYDIKNGNYVLLTDFYGDEIINSSFNIPRIKMENNVNIKVYPNPFNKLTTIEYYLPYDGHVKIDIIDIHGRDKKIYQGYKSNGQHVYLLDNHDLKPGVYYCKLTLLNDIKIIKIILK
jgi:hypothetical protein